MKNNNYNQNNNIDIRSPKTEEEFTDVMIRDTAKFQEKYGFEVGSNGSAWNNESDAFRHAYMQAYLTLKYNDFAAELLGNYHEWDGNISNNQDRAEEIMDRHNNKIGREIGNEIKKEYGQKSRNPDNPEIKEIIARKVAERMQTGELILEPSGRRTPKEKLKGIMINDKGKSNSQKGCVGSYPVSGYTRSNGTEVKGYTRTCGAKHLSNLDKKNNHLGFAEQRDFKKYVDDGCFGSHNDVIYEKNKRSVLDKYKDKKAQDLSKDQIDEFLNIYFW